MKPSFHNASLPPVLFGQNLPPDAFVIAKNFLLFSFNLNNGLRSNFAPECSSVSLQVASSSASGKFGGPGVFFPPLPACDETWSKSTKQSTKTCSNLVILSLSLPTLEEGELRKEKRLAFSTYTERLEVRRASNR